MRHAGRRAVSSQWAQAEQLLDRLPGARDGLVSEITSALGEEGVSWERDVAPALGPEVVLVATADQQAEVLRRIQALRDVLLDHAARPAPPPVTIPPPVIDDGDSAWMTALKIIVPAVGGAVTVCITERCWR